jgi:hypothetical protein
MGTGDLNPCTMGLLAGLSTPGLIVLVVCYCNTWPDGLLVSRGTQLIKVKRHMERKYRELIKIDNMIKKLTTTCHSSARRNVLLLLC